MLRKILAGIVAGVFFVGLLAAPVTLVSADASGKDASKIKVKVTVVSDAGKTLKSKTVSVKAGSTVFAVTKSVVGKKNYTYETGTWGIWFTSLYGIENGKYGGYDGWMYTVNNTVPDVGCADYTLKNGDKIKWYYSKDSM